MKTDDKWVKKSIKLMEELKKDAEEERAQWSKDAPVNYGWAMGDRKVIFGEDAKSEDALDDPEALSQYHIPLTSKELESFVASTNSSEIKPRYVPKIEQSELPEGQTIDMIARMGNAAFEAYRSHIGLEDHNHIMMKELGIFDRAYIALCVDYVKDFPYPRADVRRFNPWQVFHTPGVRFEDAKQVLLQYYIDKEEAKAQWPEWEEEINKIAQDTRDNRNEKKDMSYAELALGGNAADGVPGYGSQEAHIAGDAILVREFWRFDAGLKEYPKSSDEAAIKEESSLVDKFVNGEITLDMVDLESQFEERQYHTDHIVGHYNKIKSLMDLRDKQEMVEMTGPDLVRTVMPVPVTSAGEAERIAQVIPMIAAHAKQHEDYFDELGNPFLEGKYPKYEGGWRYSIVLGEGDGPNNSVGVYDGPSKFIEYGIQGVPISEFNLMGHALHHWGPSYVQSLIDVNKLINSFVNAAKDNANLFGSHSWWGTQTILDDDSLQISNDPRLPNQLPDNAVLNTNIGLIDAKPIPADVMQMLPLLLSVFQQVSGITASMQGRDAPGVRSGSQVQSLASLGMVPLDYKRKRMRSTWERVYIHLFKMMLALPPDDMFVKPLIDGKYVEIDYKLLKDIDFTIEVVLSPTGTSSTEERQSMLLGFIQNFGPMLTAPVNPMAIPGATSLLIEMLSDGVKTTMPDVSEALANMSKQLKQLEMQQRAMAQAQGAPPNPGNTPTQPPPGQ